MVTRLQWPLEQQTVSLYLSNSQYPQVLIEQIKDGRITHQKAECKIPFPSTLCSQNLLKLASHMQCGLYPVITKFSDGKISVVFHVRGLGGGGVCGKCCENEEEEKAPLFGSQTQTTPYQTIQSSSTQVAFSVNLEILEGKLKALQEMHQKAFSEHLQKTYIFASDLEQDAQQFLSSDQLVFLLLGEAGLGKSLFLRRFAVEQSRAYQAGGKIPLRISLPYFQSIEETLQNQGFSQEEIAYLKNNREFIFIFDAFDEASLQENWYSANRLSEWRGKLFISYRTQNLSQNKLNLFVPCSSNGRLYPNLLRVKTLASFSSAQINEFLRKEIGQGGTSWKAWQDCRKCIDKVPGLSALAKNPFHLTMMIHYLSETLEKYLTNEHNGQAKFNRHKLYNDFLQAYFHGQQKNLRENRQISSEQDLTKEFYDFCKTLAWKMQEKKSSRCMYNESIASSREWAPFFEESNSHLALVRSGCPLQKLDNEWSFSHITIYEFFLVEKLFESLNETETRESEPEQIRRVAENLNRQLLVDQKSIIQFSADRAKAEPFVQKALFEIVLLSKTEPQMSTAAANAITILNAASISLSQKNFSEVKIPYADLSGANLDGTSFRQADLRYVCMQDAFLKETVFSEAYTEEIQLGHRPFLTVSGKAEKIFFSPDQRWIGVTSNATIYIFDRVSLSLVKTFQCPLFDSTIYKSVSNAQFSSDGKYLVVSSEDECSTERYPNTDRLYVAPIPTLVFDCSSWQTRKLEVGQDRHGSSNFRYASWKFIFLNAQEILSPTFKRDDLIDPNDRSYDHDKINVWNIVTGKLIRKVEIKDLDLRNCQVSLDKQFFASSSSTSSGLSIYRISDFRLIGKISCSQSISYAFLPNNQIGYASLGGRMVCIYDIALKKIVKKIQTFSSVCNLTFSPQGDLFAFSNDHLEIVLWNLQEEREIARFSQHIDFIEDIQFTEDGNFLLSSSRDRTVRIQNISQVRPSFFEKISIGAVFFAPQSGIIAGINKKNHAEICFWNFENGDVQSTWEMDSSEWSSFAISDRGDRFFGTKGIDLVIGDLIHKTILRNISLALPASQKCIAISRDSTLCALNTVSGGEYVVQIRNIALDTVQSEIRMGLFKAYHFSFSPRGNLLAVASFVENYKNKKARLQLYNTNAGTLFDEMPNTSVSAIAVGNQIAIVAAEETANLSTSIFSPIEDLFFFANEKFEICIYSIATRRIEQTLRGHTNLVSAFGISSDGSLLASGDCYGKIHVWDLRNRQLLTAFVGHNQWVMKLGFSQDGRMLISHSNDGLVRCWNLYSATGAIHPSLRWASSPQFYAQNVQLNNMLDLSQDDGRALQQFSSYVDTSYEKNALIRKDFLNS